MNLIYHITDKQAVQSATQIGQYQTESLDSQGFIHFSQKHQILGVANSFYSGRKDLVILVVDTGLLRAELKFEAPVHPGAGSGEALPGPDQLFPHLYGPLNMDAIVAVVDFPLSGDGRFELPEI